MRMRPATEDDAAAISLLICSYSPFAPGTPDAEAFLYSISEAGVRERLRDPEHRFLVVMEEGALAGVASLHKDGKIGVFFVARQHHGRGVGRQLWDALYAGAALQGDAGPFRVNADPQAVPFYEQLGFRISGPQTTSLGVACIPMQRPA
jgi:GNAT superfamily N-acetyltransferase